MNKLKEFLIKHKINEPIPEVASPKDSAIIDTTYVRPPNLESSDSSKASINSSTVIEDIVSNNDTTLLSAIYANSMKMYESKSTEEVNEILKNISSVTRQEFLNVLLEMDINAYIEERKTWLTTYTNSFESVLDDILTLYQKEDVISMDCY